MESRKEVSTFFGIRQPCWKQTFLLAYLQQFLTVGDFYRRDKAMQLISTPEEVSKEKCTKICKSKRRNKARKEEKNPAFSSLACPALLLLYKSPTEAAVKVAD